MRVMPPFSQSATASGASTVGRLSMQKKPRSSSAWSAVVRPAPERPVTTTTIGLRASPARGPAARGGPGNVASVIRRLPSVGPRGSTPSSRCCGRSGLRSDAGRTRAIGSRVVVHDGSGARGCCSAAAAREGRVRQRDRRAARSLSGCVVDRDLGRETGVLLEPREELARACACRRGGAARCARRSRGSCPCRDRAAPAR